MDTHATSRSWLDYPRCTGAETFLMPSLTLLSVTGLNFLSSTLFASSSVDQRLNVYRIASSAQTSEEVTPPRLEYVDAAFLGVADCSAMDVLSDTAEEEDAEDEAVRRERSWEVVVVGIGVEVLRLSGCN